MHLFVVKTVWLDYNSCREAFMNTEVYIAIIGDIKDSRKLSDRGKVQEQLKQCLDQINDTFDSEIASAFIITLGDEFQGLLKKEDHVMDMIDRIVCDMAPVRIRFGVGMGRITTQINPEMSIGADGPAYHKAREAIEQLKQNEHKNRKYTPNIRIGTEGHENIAEMLNSILSLVDLTEQRRSARQKEIIKTFYEHQESQKACAVELGIAQSSVQRALMAGNYYACRDAKTTVTKMMKELMVGNV